jgi:hypothetical protein
LYTPVPHEGDDGLFRQTWYALCRASDVPLGGVTGRPFLDGRVAIYRGFDGRAQVVSASEIRCGAASTSGNSVVTGAACAPGSATRRRPPRGCSRSRQSNATA